MNNDVLLGFMLGLLGLSYLIALRCRKIMKDVECIHDFVHFLGDNHESMDVLVNAVDRIKEGQPKDQETPSPFKDWDDS